MESLLSGAPVFSVADRRVWLSGELGTSPFSIYFKSSEVSSSRSLEVKRVSFKFSFLMVLGIEPEILSALGKDSATELRASLPRSLGCASLLLKTSPSSV